MNTGLSGRPGVELRFQQVGTWPAHRRYWAGRNLEVTMTGRDSSRRLRWNGVLPSGPPSSRHRPQPFRLAVKKDS